MMTSNTGRRGWSQRRIGLGTAVICFGSISLLLLAAQFFFLSQYSDQHQEHQQWERQEQRRNRRTRQVELGADGAGRRGSEAYPHASVLVSYGYYEKDDIQLENFDFFLKSGTGESASGNQIHFSFVISSDDCVPCKRIFKTSTKFKSGPMDLGVKRVAEINRSFTLIYRTENEGMDIASHNVTFEYFKYTGRLWTYSFFLLINSSVKGPFYPSYMPPPWHWLHAYLARFRGDVHAVSSSLVCLPDFDAGGPGPRLESWALAVDQLGLSAMIDSGALNVRRCKTCKGEGEGIIVAGEYGIGQAMLERGYNIATLMSMYVEDIDWRNSSNWNCNNNIHPSRHGTYDGIAFHPFETVFVKSSWHVADPYTQRYSKWKLKHLSGQPGTEGTFDYQKYRYAISGAAQAPNGLEAAYNISASIEDWMGTPQYQWF